jgi:hypothetical protein
MRIRILTCAAVLVAILTGGGTAVFAAQATTSSRISIGACNTEGQFVSCSVQGDIRHPSGITAQVWAVPAQRIHVTWDNFCSHGFTSGSRSGHFTVRASAQHKVSRSIPLAAGHSGKCTPDVLVSLSRIGRVHLVLTGRN